MWHFSEDWRCNFIWLILTLITLSVIMFAVNGPRFHKSVIILIKLNWPRFPKSVIILIKLNWPRFPKSVIILIKLNWHRFSESAIMIKCIFELFLSNQAIFHSQKIHKNALKCNLFVKILQVRVVLKICAEFLTEIIWKIDLISIF